MTQQDWVKVAGGGVAGVALAAVVCVAVFDVDLRGGTDTPVTLYVPGTGGECMVAKQDYVHARMGRRVTWEITNHCEGADRTVVLGNFRDTPGPSGAANCDSAGADYPFAEPTLRQRTAVVAFGTTGDLTLTAKGPDELGDEPVRVYFDICLDGQIADPELMFER